MTRDTKQKQSWYGVILQLYSRARAPNRDYYGLTISTEDVVLNVWNITHGPHVFPKKQKCTLEDLPIAKTLTNEIQRLFGSHIVDYCLALGRGDARLECLPTQVFLKILRYLATNDIIKLGQTSKTFFELCSRNDVWNIIFTKRNKGKPTRDEVKAADQKGWRIVLKNKLVWSDSIGRKKIQKQAASKSLVSVVKPEVKTKITPRLESVKVVVAPSTTKSVASVSTKASNDSANITSLSPEIPKAISTPAVSLGLPPKGILKKPKHPVLSKTTSKLLTTSERLGNIVDSSNVLTQINYTPMSREALNSTPSLSKSTRPNLNGYLGNVNNLVAGSTRITEKSARDRHLDRFLQGLDVKLESNPYKLDPKLFDFPKKISDSGVKPRTTGSAKNTTKPKIVDFLKTNATSSSDKMTSKFENYLSSLKGKSVHPSVEMSPRTTKPEFLPKIGELTRSINQIRSSFYNSDKLKMKFSVNLNNTKVTNKSSCSQQLNNKRNNVPTTASTSELVVKKNVIKSHPTLTKPNKVKNTNCVESTNPIVKPKGVAVRKISARSATNV